VLLREVSTDYHVGTSAVPSVMKDDPIVRGQERRDGAQSIMVYATARSQYDRGTRSILFIVQVDPIDSNAWHVLLLSPVIDEALEREVMFTR
jgi:hypothetical protein